MNQDSTPPPALLDALHHAQEAARLGRHAAAVQHAELACGLAQGQQDDRREAQSRTVLSNALFSLGRFEEALSQGAIALGIWRRRGDAQQECHQLRVLAHSLSDNDASELALELAQAAFDRAEQSGLPSEALIAAALRGSLHGRLSDFDTAEALLLQVLSRAREGTDESLVTMVINALAAMLLDALGSHQASGETQREAAAARQLRRYGHALRRRGEGEPNAFRRAILRSNAGAALAASGELDLARALLDESIALCDDDGFRIVACRAHLRLADLHLRGGDLDAAQAELESIDRLLASEPHAGITGESLTLRCALARGRGEAQEADRLEVLLAESREARAHREAALRDALKHEALGLPARVDAIPYPGR